MKKCFILIFFIYLMACNNQWVDIVEQEEEKDSPQRPNPPTVVVDSTYVIITDTIPVSF